MFYKNGLRFDFKDEFDVVFSNATLHWVKDHNKLFANICKGLKGQGALRFNFAADGNCSTFFKVIRDVMAEKKYAQYFVGFHWPWYMPAVSEYGKILKRFSFKVAKVWGENADRFTLSFLRHEEPGTENGSLELILHCFAVMQSTISC